MSVTINKKLGICICVYYYYHHYLKEKFLRGPGIELQISLFPFKSPNHHTIQTKHEMELERISTLAQKERNLKLKSQFIQGFST